MKEQLMVKTKGFDALLIEEFPNDMYWVLGDDKLVIQAISDLPKENYYLIA